MLEWKRLSTVMTMAAAMASCQTTGSTIVGSGPLALTPEIDNNFKSYLNLPDPLAFAVSPDGKYSGWYFCNEKSACLGASANYEALNYCNDSTPRGSGSCKLYAMGRKVVWNGTVSVVSSQGPQQAVLPAVGVGSPTVSPQWRQQAAPSMIGSGPLLLSPEVNETIVKYLKLQEPLAFAVSIDGKHKGLFYCKVKGTCQGIDGKNEALNFCRQDAGGGAADCKIYAIEKDVVWNGRVMVAGDQGLQLSEISPLMGNGPLTMTVETNENFRQYQGRPEPLAFAVSNDGRHSGHFYCKEKGACLNSDAKAEALDFCRQDAGDSGVDCKIYAIGKDVVWNGRVRVAAAAPLQTAAPQAAPAEPAGERPLTVGAAPATRGDPRSSKAFRDLEEEIKRARQTAVGADGRM